MGSTLSPDILIYGIMVFIGVGVIIGIMSYLKRKK